MENTKDKYIKNLKIVSGILVVLIFILSVVLIDLVSKKYVTSNTNSRYVKVVETYDGFLVAEDVDNNTKYTIKTNESLKNGDILYVIYYKDIENPKSIEIVMSNEEVSKSEDKSIEVTTTNVVSNNETTTKVVTTTTKEKTLKNNSNENIDSIVVNYVESIKTKLDSYSKNENNKATAKEYFCNIVDFIFYDGSIKGHTFNELSSSAKAKVIYYALIIDNKIESNYPGYKDSLSEKYSNIKAKLVGKYISICEYVKTNEPELYENLKSDFILLKKSVGLTWSVVSSAFKYVGGNVVNLAKEWYENFRG